MTEEEYRRLREQYRRIQIESAGQIEELSLRFQACLAGLDLCLCSELYPEVRKELYQLVELIKREGRCLEQQADVSGE